MFLKQLLKTKSCVEPAYMTGILPIAKHSTGSELNMFVEYSALEDSRYDRFFGFTQDEVCELCTRHLARTPDARVGYEGLERWYDGYLTEDGERRFNPRSVVLALIDDSLRSYWTESGPYDEIYCYVRNTIDAVRDDLVRMVGRRAGARGDGELCRLVHEPYHQRRDILGHGGVRVPHVLRRVRVHPQPRAHAEVPEAARQGGHGLRCAPGPAQRGHAGRHASGDATTMAETIGAAHDQEVPLLRYANEADLAALVNLVYLAARDRYVVRREEPAGKGVADVAFIPRYSAEARWRLFIVELKAGGTAAQAVAQIRERDYAALFADALLEEGGSARPLAVGIAWDPKTKTHDCLVEEL